MNTDKLLFSNSNHLSTTETAAAACTPTCRDPPLDDFPSTGNITKEEQLVTLIHCNRCARPHRPDDTLCKASPLLSRHRSSAAMTPQLSSNQYSSNSDRNNSHPNMALPPARPLYEEGPTASAMEAMSLGSSVQTADGKEGTFSTLRRKGAAMPSSLPLKRLSHSFTSSLLVASGSSLHNASTATATVAPRVDDLREFVSRLTQDVRDVALLASCDSRRQTLVRNALREFSDSVAHVSSLLQIPLATGLYGSFAANVALTTSDVNITVYHGEYTHGKFHVTSEMLSLIMEHLTTKHTNWAVTGQYSSRCGIVVRAVVNCPTSSAEGQSPTTTTAPSLPHNKNNSQKIKISITLNQYQACESAQLLAQYVQAYDSFRILLLTLKALLREWNTPREQMNSTVLTCATMSFYSFHMKSLGRQHSVPGQAFFCFLQMFQQGGLFEPRTQILDPMSSVGFLPRRVHTEFQTWYVRDISPLEQRVELQQQQIQWGNGIVSPVNSNPQRSPPFSPSSTPSSLSGSRTSNRNSFVNPHPRQEQKRTQSTSPPPPPLPLPRSAAILQAQQEQSKTQEEYAFVPKSGKDEEGTPSIAEGCFLVHLFQQQLATAHDAIVRNYMASSPTTTTTMTTPIFNGSSFTSSNNVAAMPCSPFASSPFQRGVGVNSGSQIQRPPCAHLITFLLPSLEKNSAVPSF